MSWPRRNGCGKVTVIFEWCAKPSRNQSCYCQFFSWSAVSQWLSAGLGGSLIPHLQGRRASWLNAQRHLNGLDEAFVPEW